MTFSGRTARASGSRRIRAMRSARPTIRPACGPPTQLVAAERHEVGARREALARHRLVGEAVARGVEQRAAAEVVDDDRTVLVGDRRDLDRVGRLDEAGLREVRRVDPEHDRGPAHGRAGRRSRRRASGSSSRPRPAVRRPGARSRGSGRHRRSRPARRATTATPRRPASPTASASAAALLTVTSASSAPVRAMRCASAARKRGPRRPSSRSNSSSE